MEKENKRFIRSKDVKLAGVCAGLAEYIGIDTKLMRIVYACFTVITAGFPGIFLYLALMLLMPKEDSAETQE